MIYVSDDTPCHFWWHTRPPNTLRGPRSRTMSKASENCANILAQFSDAPGVHENRASLHDFQKVQRRQSGGEKSLERGDASFVQGMCDIPTESNCAFSQFLIHWAQTSLHTVITAHLYSGILVLYCTAFIVVVEKFSMKIGKQKTKNKKTTTKPWSLQTAKIRMCIRSIVSLGFLNRILPVSLQ